MRMPSAPIPQSFIKILPLVCVVLMSPPSATSQSGKSDLDRAAAGWDAAFRADLFQYDLGEGSWDLVTNVYFNPSVHFFDRLKAAVRPGGFLLVEGYGSDYTGSGPAAETRYRPNQLLAELSNWRILEYQDGVFPSDWAHGQSVPVVRILAQRLR